ncbi:MAG: endonuclease/exonuclease/phosphatase family protein, partial [Bryobacteraceae bacterium]
RPPLVLRARADELDFTAVMNHLRSLIDVQDPGVQAKRRAQADALAELVRARLPAGPPENLIVLGDFNAFPFDDGYVDVIARIRAGGDLVNLADTLPREQSYTYVQDGSAQWLDHILVSRGMMSSLSRYSVARINADFPEVWSGDAGRPERTSDHDVPIAYFSLVARQISGAGVTHSASFLGGAVSGGEIVTIFGSPVGPPAGVTAQLTPDGQSITTALGQTRVLFDGVAAPMIYAQAGQASAIVPYGVTGRTTSVRVEFRGQLSNEVTLPVAATAPGVFAILNQDGAVNAAGAPAERDSIIVIFATGEGATMPRGQNGRLTSAPFPRPVAAVQVIVDGFEAEILYAGAAPGFVSGLLQVNARVPRRARAGRVPVWLYVGENGSQQGLSLVLR